MSGFHPKNRHSNPPAFPNHAADNLDLIRRNFNRCVGEVLAE